MKKQLEDPTIDSAEAENIRAKKRSAAAEATSNYREAAVLAKQIWETQKDTNEPKEVQQWLSRWLAMRLIRLTFCLINLCVSSHYIHVLFFCAHPTVASKVFELTEPTNV